MFSGYTAVQRQKHIISRPFRGMISIAGSSLLQRRQATRAARSVARQQKPVEAIERGPLPKDSTTDASLPNILKPAQKTQETSINNIPREHDQQPSDPHVPVDVPLFPVTIDPAVSKKLPEGYHIRSLRKSDYHKGYTDLKRIGPIESRAWDERCEYLRSRTDIYTILVITDTHDKICCTGTLFLERRLTKNMSVVGHIQDIFVADGHRGKTLSYRMLSQLERHAYAVGATRTVASTQAPNISFYKQKGFKQTGVEMTRSFLRSLSSAEGGGDEEGYKSRSPSFERLDRELELAAARFGGISGGVGNEHVAWSPVLE